MSDLSDQLDNRTETEVRSWFDATTTPAAPPSLHAFAAQLELRARTTTPVRRLSSGWRRAPGNRLAAAATTVAVVVLAGGLLMIAGGHTPAAFPGPSKSAEATLRPSGSPLLATPIDDGGVFGSSGLWAVAGAQLYLSTDYGTTWVERRLISRVALDATSGDVLSSVFVLDATHMWTASPGAGSTDPYSGQGPGFDHLSVVVSRSADGGATWQSVTISGDWGGTQPVVTFADQEDGFLLLSGLRGGGASVVFATSDGGATWQRVGGSTSLGSIFSASDAATLWAGNEGDAGPVERPILDVSRDGARTWTDAGLPGLVGDIHVNDNPVAPPVFSGQDGAVAVIAASIDTFPIARFYRTSDGGRTWLLAAQVLMGHGSDGVAVIDPTHFVVLDGGAGAVMSTGDGGATWQRSTSSGLGAALRIRFWDPRVGAALVQLTNGPAPAVGLFRTADGGQMWSPVSIALPSPAASTAETCSASQLVLGAATSAYGFGTFGTTSGYVTRAIRNTGSACVFALPGTIRVATANGASQAVPVFNPGIVTVFNLGSGDSLLLVIGASWWTGVTPYNGTPLPAPPCADAIGDVSRVEIPLTSGSLAIDLDTPWQEVCSSPASVSITFVTK